MKDTLRLPIAVPRPLRLFFVVMFTLNVIAGGCEIVSKAIFHLDWPYTSPLMDDPSITDLAFATPLFQHLHTPEFFSPSNPVPFMYPAALAPVFGLLVPLANHPLWLEAVLLLLALLAALAFTLRLRRTRLSYLQSGWIVATTVLLSYPLLFELKQGNVELFICLLVGGGVWCFLHERWHTAAVLFGIAGAMKLFPFVYLGLFLAKRRYNVVVTAVITAVVVTLASLRYLDPSISVAWHGIAANLAYYQRTVVLDIRREIGFDHSFFGLMKTRHFVTWPLNLRLRLNAYLALAACGGLVLFVLRIRYLPVINQVLCLCVASVLLPPVSYDYTLLHLYIPWSMLVLFAVQERERFTPGLTAVFLCFAVLMSIQTEFIWNGRSHGGQIKAILLVVLMILALRFPFDTYEAASLESRL